MRISDWSSDVCSSDLARISDRRDCGADPAGERGPPPSIPDNSLPIVIPAKAGMTATSLTGLRAGLHRRRRFGGHSGRRARQFDRETAAAPESRSEEHTSELQSLMRISYAVFCLKKTKKQ